MFRLSEWILKHRSESLAIFTSLTLIAFSVYNTSWWGDRAVGVWIGMVSLVAGFQLIMFLLEKAGFDPQRVEKASFNPQRAAPWVFLVIIPISTALIARSLSGYRLVWPIEVHTPATPSPKSLLLILVTILMILLLMGLIRALSRGEGITLESNWGGLGGGLGGFRISTPFVYLLGVMFLLLVGAAVAWGVFLPPGASPDQKSNQAGQTSSTNSPTSAGAATQSNP
jgi:hypothetical protein